MLFLERYLSIVRYSEIHVCVCVCVCVSYFIPHTFTHINTPRYGCHQNGDKFEWIQASGLKQVTAVGPRWLVVAQ